MSNFASRLICPFWRQDLKGKPPAMSEQSDAGDGPAEKRQKMSAGADKNNKK